MSYQIQRVTTFLLATKVITQCFRDISWTHVYPFGNKWSPWQSFVMHAHYKDKNTLIRHVCSANLYACIRFNVSFRLHMDGCVLDNLNKQMGNLLLPTCYCRTKEITKWPYVYVYLNFIKQVNIENLWQHDIDLRVLNMYYFNFTITWKSNHFEVFIST